MKHKLLNFISILAVVSAVVLSMSFTALALEEPDKSSPLPARPKTSSSVTDSEKESAETHKKTCSSNHYYGNQLETNQERQIYTVLDNHLISGRKISRTGTISLDPPLALEASVSYDDETAVTEEVLVKLQRALDAFRFDHPEVYWTTGGTAFSDILVRGTNNGSTQVLSLVVNFQPLGGDYTADDAAIKSEINKIINAAKTHDNHYDRIKTVHDMLAEQIEYTSTSKIPYRSFQISGGLVDGYGVCEAYAKSFKLIAEKLGYDVILAAGKGVGLDSTEPHMWNYIKVDGKWYGVDVTWDDQSITVYDYFLAGKKTPAPHFGDNMFSESHIEEYVFNNVKYKPFVYPQLSNNSYVAS